MLKVSLNNSKNWVLALGKLCLEVVELNFSYGQFSSLFFNPNCSQSINRSVDHLDIDYFMLVFA